LFEKKLFGDREIDRHSTDEPDQWPNPWREKDTQAKHKRG